MSIVVTHVYSATNSGDGLLARLTSNLVEEAAGARPTLLAIDPRGMEDSEVLTFGQKPRSIVGALRATSSAIGLGTTAAIEAIRGADLVVAIGGGYLRASRSREAVVLGVTHLPQLKAETELCGHAIFLPQSIGPLPRALRGMVTRRLERARAVLVRDDRSFDLLRSLPNVHRAPDLAVLEVARTWDETAVVDRSNRGDQVLLQVRDLPAVPGYANTVRDAARNLGPRMVPTIQLTSGSTNDDLPFTEATIGPSPAPLSSVLAGGAQKTLGAALCGRLHAALACILHGIPAIHIAYERKSYGAFADLGISDYLIQPKDVGSPELARRVHQLCGDSEHYWSRIQARIPRLCAERDDLVALIREAASRPAP